MADTATLYKALRAAHDAGDTASATRIANMIKAAGPATPAPAPAPAPATATAPAATPAPAPAPATADDGRQPVPVADQPAEKPDYLKAVDYAKSFFPASDPWPGYTPLREGLTGMAEGVADLPNIVPNLTNAGNRLYHAATDPAGAPWPPPQYAPKWFDTPAADIERLNPPDNPGWEHFRAGGRVAGGALPFGPLATIAAPVLYNAGGRVGSLFDTPSTNHKWEDTGEIAAPLVAGGVRTGSSILSRSGMPLPSMGYLGYTALGKIDPSLPFVVKGGVGAGRMAARTSSGDALTDLSQTFRSAIAPQSGDPNNPAFRGPR